MRAYLHRRQFPPSSPRECYRHVTCESAPRLTATCTAHFCWCVNFSELVNFMLAGSVKELVAAEWKFPPQIPFDFEVVNGVSVHTFDVSNPTTSIERVFLSFPFRISSHIKTQFSPHRDSWMRRHKINFSVGIRIKFLETVQYFVIPCRGGFWKDFPEQFAQKHTCGCLSQLFHRHISLASEAKMRLAQN